MPSSHHITSEEAGPSLQEKGTWPLALFCLHQRLASYFARPEPFHHALLYLQAVMSEIPRKNGWQIAEHGKQARPSGMQRLLSRAVWDDEGVRNEIRTLLVQTLSPPPVPPLGTHGDTREEILFPFPVIVVDETGIPKRGTHSAGVKVQYCGSTGRVENCQVGVVLTYVTALGHALMDAALYIPEEWCGDPDRRHIAHIPEQIHFQTKPELAQGLLQRAISASLPIRWVVGDTVYGHSTDLRAFLHDQGLSFALAVPDNEVVCVDTVLGYRLGEVASIERLLPDGTLLWQRLSMSQGTKGERLFDWAIVPQVHRTIIDGCHFLVIRRCLDAPFQKAYYFVFAPPQTSLQTMVLAIGARWCVEVDLENAKDLGLDHYEVRSCIGWYRHITLVLLASAFLLSICVQDHQRTCQSEEASCSLPLIALTTSEVRHLLARLFWPAPTHASLIHQWSIFRREHQYWARYYHCLRRLKAG